ncbi:hypothetical protein [Salinimonas sediminis]|uniref:hypothetical protein n=1 Tax=Salinimonas sediminis TaxID=2303538 RepID=UPI00147275C5|nr:hypothetical protein [Salinimonas sediminis]
MNIAKRAASRMGKPDGGAGYAAFVLPGGQFSESWQIIPVACGNTVKAAPGMLGNRQ